MALLCACGRDEDALGVYPPPGEMRVVSMERIDRGGAAESLLTNGDFSQWWAGAPVPNGFIPPAETDSVVERQPVGEKQVMVQQWKAPNVAYNLVEMLRTETAPLKKGGRYTLRVTAAAPAGRVATFALWHQGEGGVWQPLALNFLSIQPAGVGVKTYAKSFTTERDGPLAIAATGAGATGAEHATAWLQWELVEEGA